MAAGNVRQTFLWGLGATKQHLHADQHLRHQDEHYMGELDKEIKDLIHSGPV